MDFLKKSETTKMGLAKIGLSMYLRLCGLLIFWLLRIKSCFNRIKGLGLGYFENSLSFDFEFPNQISRKRY